MHLVLQEEKVFIDYFAVRGGYTRWMQDLIRLCSTTPYLSHRTLMNWTVLEKQTKVQQIFEAMSGNGKMLGMSSSLPNEESRRYFAINLAPMNVEKPLMITNVGTFRKIDGDEPIANSENFRNSIGVTRQSVSEMKDWQREFTGKLRPTMILCASGEPQKGGNGMLAFPDFSTILTYQVTFDKRWSAKLKDIIRVQ